jgi:DNA-binding LytR/AlgR family response regulator
MEKINVLIVEDSLLVAEFIAAKLKAHNLEVVGLFVSGEDAIASLDKIVPDLVLMDIELAGAMDGISTAQIINQRFQLPIIYLSDYTDEKTVDRAKKTTPANYLSKPFNELELIRAIDLAFYNAKIKTGANPRYRDQFIFIRTNNQVYLKLMFDEILYLQADRAYCNIVTETKPHTLSSSMNKVHEQLNHPDFVKVHRSFVVNLNKISAIEGRMIRIGQHTIQMNEDTHDDLLSKFKWVK